MNTKLRSLIRTALPGTLVPFCLILATGAQAATLYWDNNTSGMTDNPPTAGGGGANGSWSNGANWWDGTVYQTWADNNVADFRPAGGSARTVTNTANVAVEGLVFSGNWTLANSAGAVLSLNNVTPNITFAGANASVIGAKLDGALNVVGTTDTSSIGVRIAGANTGVTNTTINLSAANNIVDVANTSAFGSAGATLHLMSGKLYLDVNLGGTYNNWPTTLGAGTLFRARNANTSVGASLYPGNIALAGNANITVRSVAGNSLTCSGTIDLASFTLLLTPGDTSSGLNLPNTISGAGSILLDANAIDTTTTGAGVVRLSGANTFTGTATVTKGTLALTNVNALQNATLNTGASAGTVNTVTFTIPGANTYNLGALTGADDLAIGANTISVGTKAEDHTFTGIISGAGGKLSKVGGNILTLDAANTYDGVTTIGGGTLALGGSGSLAAGSSVSIAPGATFDVSAQAAYTHGSSASLTASATATTPAIIFGGATVDLGSRPVTLNYTPDGFTGDANSPALNLPQGALSINSAITLVNNGALPLGVGTYVLISQASGTITGTPTLSGTVGGQGLASGSSATLQVSGASVQLVVQSALPTTTALYRTNGTPASSTYGDTLQFGVSVLPAAATGNVELRDGGPAGMLVGNGSLVSGVVTITPALTAIKAGLHDNLVALYLGDVNYQASTSAALSTQTVSQRALTISGATADNKYYDTTTTATVAGTLSGEVSPDVVTLSGGGTFATAGPGTAIAVTSTSTLSGADMTNYWLTQPTGLAADIYAAAVWTNNVGDSLWSSLVNWSPNLFPSGANVTADFSTLDLTANQAVNLDSAPTIGTLVLGDTDTNTAASWTLANNGTAANILTLAGTAPKVTVNLLGTGAKVIISTVVAGTSGLTKTGAGTLAFTGANTYSGSTVIRDGVLTYNADTALGVAPGTPTPGSLVLNGGTLAQAGANLTLSANRGIAVGANGGTIAVASPGSGNLTYGGIITGSGPVTLNASVGTSGILLQSPNSTYTGGTIALGVASANVFCLASTVGNPGSLVTHILAII
jgi:autotransporter-associated beta strand protein